MKIQFTILLILIAFTTILAQSPAPADTTLVYDSIPIPPRQQQKLAQIEQQIKEMEARRFDILDDILAVHGKRIEGATYAGISGTNMIFTRPKPKEDPKDKKKKK